MLMIERTFNNNVALVKIDQEREGIVIGNGIAFKKTSGDVIDPKKVERIFYLENSQSSQAIFSLLQNIPLDIVASVIELIDHARKKYNYHVFDYIYISLSEHVRNVYRNLIKGTYQASMIPDMQASYPTEYQIAQDGLKILDKNLKTVFPKSEMRSIALHFINSKDPSQEQAKAGHEQKINPDVMLHKVQMILDQNNIYRTASNNTDFDRLMIHFQYLIERINEQKMATDNQFEAHFGKELRKTYPKAYKIVEKILRALEEATKTKIPLSERSYLLIHIQRIMSEKAKS